MIGTIPDGTTPIEAWRMWLIWEVPTEDGDMTRIGSNPRPGYIWPPLAAEPAVCRRKGSRHRAPARGCVCGYYGVTPEAFFKKMTRRASAPFAVLGKVHLWGKVIVCERGWRAEFAYPAELYLPQDARWRDGDVQSYADDLLAYGVRVEIEPMQAVLKMAV